MSNTRKAAAGAPPAWHRYMSSPAYVELRGVPGSAVAAKAALLTAPRKRSLLFFLQALSCRRGGLKKLAADILAAFPERLGSPTMHQTGIKPGRVYAQEEAEWIFKEIGDALDYLNLETGDCEPIPKSQRTAEVFSTAAGNGPAASLGSWANCASIHGSSFFYLEKQPRRERANAGR